MKIPNFLEENINNEKINDIYNREIIVDNIYNFINENDKRGSVKIGLYGSWGSGKTTILKSLSSKFKSEVKSFRFILTRPKVIFLDIRNVDSIKKVYSFFINDIKDSFGLFRGYIYLYFKIVVSIFIFILFLSFVISFFKSFDETFNISIDDLMNSKSIWGVIIVSVLGLFIKWVFSKNFIEGYNNGVDSFFITIYLFVKKYILKRKILIVVDDLDRLNPTFLPDILLWLSRISEIEKGLVNVIISADPQKLSEGIKISNNQYSGNEGYEFLEKIIDTPYYIDDLNKSSKALFWNKYKNELIKDFNGFIYIEDFIDYLPNNIRQIKRYFRFLYTYIDELNRYGEDELNIKMLLFISLFKLEHPKECLDFIKNDIDVLIKTHHGLMYYKENEDSKNFRNNLSSTIKQKYFDFISGKSLFIKDIQSFYYFFDNIDKITKKEFFEFYLSGNKSFEDLKKLYVGNYIELLQFLIENKDFYYGRLVDEKLLSNMKVNEKYVKKIYSYIIDLISIFEDDTYILNDDFRNIVETLMRYSNFIENSQGINFKLHRETETKILKLFITKINKDTFFIYRSSLYTYLSKKYIDDKYWKYFITTLDKYNYNYKLRELDIRKFVYERIINFNGISDLSKINRNDILNNNLFYLLYGFLEEIKDKPDDTEKIIIIVNSKYFKDLFMKIPFSILNYRILGSLKLDILDKLPGVYNEPLKYLRDEIDKYIS